MANEYYRRGVAKAYFLASAPAITASPTTVEIAAGVDLSVQLNAIDGFSNKTTFIDVENLSSQTTTSLSGPIKADGGSLTFNEKKNPSGVTSSSYDTILAAMTQGTTGYLLLAPYGGTAGNDVEVWPVTVGSFSRKWDMGNTPGKWMADMAVTGTPTQHATIGLYVASLACVPSTLALTASGNQIKRTVATATMSDASTSDVSYQATWTTSDASKATVDHGYVRAVAAGTPTITATYVAGGTTFTATCVVTVS